MDGDLMSLDLFGTISQNMEMIHPRTTQIGCQSHLTNPPFLCPLQMRRTFTTGKNQAELGLVRKAKKKAIVGDF
jgi:hypothetical protein